MIAKEYDDNRRKFIPCFDEFYEHTTNLILSNINSPQCVLDLGAGTGILTYYWFKKCKTAKYFLIDIADDMLDISKRRFAGFTNIYHYVMDYTKQFPNKKFDSIISALSIHHLDDIQKAKLFHKIYEILPVDGIFVNYDQFSAGTTRINKWFDLYWERELYSSGLTNRDIELWKERRKLDKECSVEKEIEMLNRNPFSDVKCLYSHHKFSVIIAVK